MRIRVLIFLLGLVGNIACAHNPYEITSEVYVRSNVIEILIELEFPTGMKLAGVAPARDMAVPAQFEKAQPQLATLAGHFFDFTAGNNKVAALRTNVALGVEDHIQLKVEYAVTSARPLQFTARGLRGMTEAPYGTSLTVLDMVNQKVLGQTMLFAESPRAEFPPPVEAISTEASAAPATQTNVAPALMKPVSAPNLMTASDPTSKPSPPTGRLGGFRIVTLLGLAFVVAFVFFRRRE